MSTALVSSAFYDMADVIQQSKQRPMMIDMRQKMEESRRPSNLLISRRHSTNSMNTLAAQLTSKPQVMSPSIPSSNMPSNFFAMPPSPKDQYLASPFRERCQSAQTFQEEIDAQQRKRSTTNSSRYKTELCRPFEENGTCKYGDKCQFAHGYHELRGLNRHPKYKTEFCRTYHTIGFCPYGPRCHFIHNDEEKKLAHSNLGRSCSMGSMGDSVPPSPALDVVPSPFSNSLTPPTSPGFGGDVFLFDEPQQQQMPSMSVIPENLTTSHMDFPQRRQAMSESCLPIELPKFDERFTTPSDSGSSNPPSPVGSIEDSKRRLPVFGGLNS